MCTHTFISISESQKSLLDLALPVEHEPTKNRDSYLLFGALFQSDPVLSVRADIHFVGLDKVNPPRLLGDGALGAYSRDETQEPEVHLWRVRRERDGG